MFYLSITHGDRPPVTPHTSFPVNSRESEIFFFFLMTAVTVDFSFPFTHTKAEKKKLKLKLFWSYFHWRKWLPLFFSYTHSSRFSAGAAAAVATPSGGGELRVLSSLLPSVSSCGQGESLPKPAFTVSMATQWKILHWCNESQLTW